MHWDPFTTLQHALWIGGGQWAGKSTVARLLAEDYGLTHYHYDYHDARGHNDRRIARRVLRGESTPEPDRETVWIETTPEQMARDAVAVFVERFEWVQDDLRPTALATLGRLPISWLSTFPRTCRRLPEGQLHPFVASDEAEPLVEPVRVETRLVGGQLHQHTAPLPSPFDHPRHKPRTEPLPATIRSDPNGLDKCSLGAVAAQPGNVGDLQAGDDLGVVLRHNEKVARVGCYVGERPLVSVVHHGNVPRLAQHVVDEEREDCG
jgi:hypothetical protein